MHLLLIRHGESYVNLPDWDGGFIDASLTPLGQQQAEILANWLARHFTANALYASTMRRAVETAEFISKATGLSAAVDDRIREIGNCWPDASSINVEEEAPEYADFWATERPFSPISPGGETWMDFITRVGRFLIDVTEAHPNAEDTVLVVCHGGVINAAMDIAFNVGPRRHADVWLHNTSITHWEYNPADRRQEPWRLHGFNLNYHLLETSGAILGYNWRGYTP